MAKVVKKKVVRTKPSAVISRNKFAPFSVVSGNKNISYESFSNGKTVNKYIPNTKVNRDELTRLRGKPCRYGKRLIWW